MNKKLWGVIIALALVVPVMVIGCKAKAEKPMETEAIETPEMIATTDSAQGMTAATEPAQAVATETIPPTAAVPQAATPAQTVALDRAKDIQKALKNAGYYTGTIDGKIGPRTKKAVEAFQKAKGLKVDGRVGPKTWAELEKYLVQ